MSSLNHVFKVKWSVVLNAFIVVPEIASGKCKSQATEHQKQGPTDKVMAFLFKCSAIFTALSVAFAPSIVLANPSGFNPVSGNTTMSVSGDSITLTQTTTKAIVNWDSFSIGANEKVNVIQPNGGMALYRVMGNDASSIYGSITATGTIFLVNPNGIYFGPNAQVDVGSIVASSLNIQNSDFLNGNYLFSGNSTSSVENLGVIKAANEGYIVLLGSSVANGGQLTAKNGSISLGAASEAYLDFYGNGLVRTKLNGDAVQAIVNQSGAIQADGGAVQLATHARSSAINMNGIIQANRLVERNGTIHLEGGSDSQVSVYGSLEASSGEVAVTGEQVALFKGAKIDVSGLNTAGNIYIGGGLQGKNTNLINSRTTYVGDGVNLNASAGIVGNGGQVIVWADGSTKFFGDIVAKGGSESGDGGFAEVSGKSYLNFSGKVDLSSKNGVSGTLLLDPTNIYLVTGTASNTTGFNPASDLTEAFTDDSGQDSYFNVANGGSFAGVAAGSTIVLQAANNINVNSLFNVNTATGQNNVNLELYAGNNININAGTGIVGSSLGSVKLYADTDAGNTHTGVGDINMQADIRYGSGGLTMYGVNILSTNNSNIRVGNNFALGTLGANFQATATGNFNIGTGSINTALAGTNSNNAGNVSINASSITSGNINANAVVSNDSSLVQSGGNGGNITLSTSSGQINVGNLTTNGAHSYGATVGNGGNIILSSVAGINTGAESTFGGNSLTGSGVPSNTNKGGNAGNITINNTTSGNISLGAISTSGGVNGGSSSGIANTGAVSITNTVVNGAITTSSINTSGLTNQDGGNISVSALGTVSVGDITTSGGGTAYISTPRKGGVVMLSGSTINATNITTKGGLAASGNNNGGAAGSVTFTANTGVINITTVDASGGNRSGTGIAGAGGTVTFNGNTYVNGATTSIIASSGSGAVNGIGGNIIFNGQVNSGSLYSDLFLNTNGTTQFNSNVGALRQLNSVTTDAGGVTEVNSVNFIKTISGQTFNDAVTIKQIGPTFDGGAGNVVFNSTLNSNLTACCVTANVVTSGNIYFNNNVGLSSTLYSLNVTGNNLYIGSGLTVKTQTGQNYNANIVFAGNGTLHSQSGGSISLNKTVTSPGVLNVTTTRGNFTAANANNDFNEIVFGSLGGVNITDKNSIILSATNSSGSFKVNTQGDITVKGGITNLAAGQDITLISANGNILINADVIATRNTSVNLTGQSIIRTAGNISTGGGSVNITAIAGNIDFLGTIQTGGLLDGATGNSANSGSVSAKGTNIVLGAINTTANSASSTLQNVKAGDSGNLTIQASGSLSTGDVDLSGASSASNLSISGKAGNINITASTGILTGNLKASGGDTSASNSMGGSAGDIQLYNTTTGNINIGTITAKAGDSTALNPSNLHSGSISIVNVGGNVSAGSVDVAGVQNTAGGGVAVKAGNTVTYATISTNGGDATAPNSNGGNAGTVKIEAINIRGGNISSVGGDASGLGAAGSGGAILIDGNLELTSNVTFSNESGHGNPSNEASDIQIRGTVNSIYTTPFSFTLNTDGDVNIDGAVTTVSDVAIRAGGDVTAKSISASGDISIEAFGKVALVDYSVSDFEFFLKGSEVTTQDLTSKNSDIKIETAEKLSTGNLEAGESVEISASNGEIQVGSVNAKDHIVMLANGDIQINGYILTVDSDVTLSGENIIGTGHFVSSGANTEIQAKGLVTLGSVSGKTGVNIKSTGNSFLDAVSSQSGNVLIDSNSDIVTGNISVSNSGHVQIIGDEVSVGSISAGSISAKSEADFTMNGKLESYSNTKNAIEVKVGGSFRNVSNASVVTNNDGHFQIYTATRSGNDFGNTVLNQTDFLEYGKVFGDTLSSNLSGLIFSESKTADIYLTGNIVKTFDGKVNASAGSDFATVTGQHPGDRLNPKAELLYDSPEVGQRVISIGDMTINPVTAEGKPVYGYQFNVTSDLTGQINKVPASPAVEPGSQINAFRFTDNQTQYCTEQNISTCLGGAR